MSPQVNHVRRAVNPIRPSAQPPTSLTPMAGPAQDAAKLAAQRAFFAMVSGQAQPAAVAQAAAPQAAAPAVRAVMRAAVQPAEPPQKIMRPGSLFDIRV
ncbi:hypothetical protein [Phenylobacterium sp.]|uniref:hypothetical protein n=1 Tax=Phenylobacterium sp. TaxID=1871053 RepID=UPI0025ED6EE4|nr:hypothetical protein [Phenylobacterium sp.]